VQNAAILGGSRQLPSLPSGLRSILASDFRSPTRTSATSSTTSPSSSSGLSGLLSAVPPALAGLAAGAAVTAVTAGAAVAAGAVVNPGGLNNLLAAPPSSPGLPVGVAAGDGLLKPLNIKLPSLLPVRSGFFAACYVIKCQHTLGLFLFDALLYTFKHFL
jgi:hypothetical protein